MIGLIGLNSFDRLLYTFHPDFWGAGYCTEALRWFLKQLFKMQPERVALVAGVHDGNERSLTVLLKCGFVKADSLESAMGGLSKHVGDASEVASGSSTATSSHVDFTWFRFERRLVAKD
jgi:RimJ/RimL family protein N-acetyltransferase